jgi:hypothetical protein
MIKKLLLTVALFATSFGFAQTDPTIAWGTRPADNAVLTIGSTLSLSATYNAGNNGADPLVEYLVGPTNIVQFSISEKSVTSTYAWKAGVNDATSKDQKSGTATKAWVVPNLTPSASLPDGKIHVLRVGYQNSNGAWASGAAEIPITIVEGGAVDSWSFNPTTPVFTSSATTLDVNIKYTSDTDIAVGGVKFTLWTITGGTFDFPSDDPDQGAVNMFSDIWHGLYSNDAILTAGTNKTAVITIAVPASAKNGSGFMYPSSDLGAVWDPNAGDAGNKYVDHATSPASEYTYQFRQVAGADAAFVPLSYSQNAFTVEVAASVANVDNKNISVYPNPTTGVLNISDIEGAKVITVTSITGQVVKTFDAQKTIDISSLAPGVYVLKANNGIQRKIIKN